MAVTTWEADVQNFEDQFHGSFVEVAQENAQEVAGASQGGINLSPRAHRGNFLEESLWTNTSSLISRRDTESSSTATDLQITQDEDVRVKLSRTVGPVKWTEDSFVKIMEDPDRGGQIVGQQAAQADAEEKLDRAFAAFIGAIQTDGNNDFDATDGTITTTDLVEGLNLMGDKRGRIVAWVMHSKVFNDLLKDQIGTGGPEVDRVAGFGVATGTPVTLGRPVVLVDNDELVASDGVSSGVDEYHTLGLVEDGIRIHPSEPMRQLTERRGGEDNIYIRYQAEYAYTLGIMGFQWDITNGGKNPTDSNVGTGSNWDVWAADSKSFGGVLIRSR